MGSRHGFEINVEVHAAVLQREADHSPAASELTPFSDEQDSLPIGFGRVSAADSVAEVGENDLTALRRVTSLQPTNCDRLSPNVLAMHCVIQNRAERILSHDANRQRSGGVAAGPSDELCKIVEISGFDLILQRGLGGQAQGRAEYHNQQQRSRRT